MIKEKQLGSVYVYFDNDCGICKSSVAWLSKISSKEPVKYLPNTEIYRIGNKDLSCLELFERSKSVMIAFIEEKQKLLFGYDCFVLILGLSNSKKRQLISAAMKFYPVRLVGVRVYKTIARNRRFFSGRGASCGL